MSSVLLVAKAFYYWILLWKQPACTEQAIKSTKSNGATRGILLSDEKARATDKHNGRGASHTQNAEQKKPGSGCTLSNFTAVKLGNANESTVTENRPAFPRARAI